MRNPRQIIAKISPDGKNGNWRTVRSFIGKENVPRRFSMVWDDEPVRYLRFDLGKNTDRIGSRMSDVRVFPRFQYPPLAERLSDIDNLLKPDLAELQPFRSALVAEKYDEAVVELPSPKSRRYVKGALPFATTHSKSTVTPSSPAVGTALRVTTGGLLMTSTASMS